VHGTISSPIARTFDGIVTISCGDGTTSSAFAAVLGSHATTSNTFAAASSAHGTLSSAHAKTSSAHAAASSSHGKTSRAHAAAPSSRGTTSRAHAAASSSHGTTSSADAAASSSHATTSSAHAMTLGLHEAARRPTRSSDDPAACSRPNRRRLASGRVAPRRLNPSPFSGLHPSKTIRNLPRAIRYRIAPPRSHRIPAPLSPRRRRTPLNRGWRLPSTAG
jgi:hypothetical protein